MRKWLKCWNDQGHPMLVNLDLVSQIRELPTGNIQLSYSDCMVVLSYQSFEDIERTLALRIVKER